MCLSLVLPGVRPGGRLGTSLGPTDPRGNLVRLPAGSDQLASQGASGLALGPELLVDERWPLGPSLQGSTSSLPLFASRHQPISWRAGCQTESSTLAPPVTQQPTQVSSPSTGKAKMNSGCCQDPLLEENPSSEKHNFPLQSTPVDSLPAQVLDSRGGKLALFRVYWDLNFLN